MTKNSRARLTLVLGGSIRAVLLLLLVVGASGVRADVPSAIPFQGLLLDTTGKSAEVQSLPIGCRVTLQVHHIARRKFSPRKFINRVGVDFARLKESPKLRVTTAAR